MYRIYSWGANNYGQLGHGHNEDLLEPTFTGFICNEAVITGGGGHTVLYETDCSEETDLKLLKVYTCGWNNKGQLGLPITNDNILSFTETPVLSHLNVKKIVCGWDFTLCLANDGKLYGFGSNAFGQLGRFSGNSEINIVLEDLADVVAGLRHSAAVLNSGCLYTWGNGKKGQLGVPDRPKMAAPVQVALPGPAVKVVAGAYHTAVLLSSGDVAVMGDNKHGQMALDPGISGSCETPHVLPREFFGGTVTNIWSGWTHILAQTENGDIYSWGRNDYGQLGRTLGTAQGYDPRPQRIAGITHPRSITCGSEHTLLLTQQSQVLSWGWNEHGICGTGNEDNVPVPSPVKGLEDKHIVDIGCGMGHCFVVVKVDR